MQKYKTQQLKRHTKRRESYPINTENNQTAKMKNTKKEWNKNYKTARNKKYQSDECVFNCQ